MRDKPDYGDNYGWRAFDEWADENGVGEQKDDWEPWWECWKRATIIAIIGKGEEK